MRKLVLILFLFPMATLFGQNSTTDSMSWVNGYLRFDGVDDLGGQVLVVYNDEFNKVYHERSTKDETVYVRYDSQGIVEYGTIRQTPKRRESEQLEE